MDDVVITREHLVRDEAARQKQLAERRKEILSELDQIAPPVSAFRAAERRVNELERQLQSMNEFDSATRGEYNRTLERSMPDETKRTLQRAHAELTARRSAEQDPAAMRQLADLRQWYTETTTALGDPSTTSAALKEMARAGERLLSVEAVAR